MEVVAEVRNSDCPPGMHTEWFNETVWVSIFVSRVVTMTITILDLIRTIIKLLVLIKKMTNVEYSLRKISNSFMFLHCSLFACCEMIFLLNTTRYYRQHFTFTRWGIFTTRNVSDFLWSLSQHHRCRSVWSAGTSHIQRFSLFIEIECSA